MAEERETGKGPGCKVCLRCGKLVAAADKFCVSCGANLLAPPAPGQAGAVLPRDFRGVPPAYLPSRQPLAAGYPPSPARAAGHLLFSAKRGTNPVIPAPQAGPPRRHLPAQAMQEAKQPLPRPPLPPLRARKARTGGKAEDLAVASVISGIAGFTILPFVAAAAAIITGSMALKGMRSGAASAGEALAMTGIALGVAGIIVAAVLVVLLLVL